MRAVLLPAVLMACSQPVTSSDAPASAEPDTTPATPQAVCEAEHCASADDHDACMASSCAETPAVVSAGAQTIRFEEHTLFVQLNPTYQPAKVGDTEIPRAAPMYAGVTAVTPSGTEIDLLVHELMPGPQMDAVVFTAELDDRIDHVLVGLWDHKIEPCDVARSGCEDFGFVLDGSLATYPPNVYATGQRQRLLVDDLTIALAWDDSERQAIETAIRTAAEPIVAVYGVTVSVQASTKTSATGAEVRHKHPRDAYIAQQITDALKSSTGIAPVLRYVPDMTSADIEVVSAP